MGALNYVFSSTLRSLKSKKSEFVWPNSIKVKFESSEYAKSTVEDSVVGRSKSREHAELEEELSN
jgi:hypothetical protein